jgi:hypothetical protein
MPDTETLDRFYLEWSQFTRARNKRELELLDAAKKALDQIEVPVLGSRMKWRAQKILRNAIEKAEKT